MPISKNSRLSNEKHYVTFSVDQYEDSVIKGIVTWGNDTQGRVCVGFLDFISQMESIFEEQGAPLASVNKRMLACDTPYYLAEREACSCRNGKLATFAIQVQYRQNASWQGRMVHKETKEKYVFRSFRQLMIHICAVVENRPVEETAPVSASAYVEQLVQELKICLADEDKTNNYLEVQKLFPNSLFCRYIYQGSSISFGIRLKFKANSSWQGMIYWRELRQEITFRSFMELILLISQSARANLTEEEPA
ncbi:MAG: hypothetical protein ACRDBO_05945 [Lachnospiraceae bacterium]